MTSLSVVVTVVDGAATLERLLTALAAQEGGPTLEVVVPWDDSLAGMPGMTAEYPQFRFLPLGRLTTRRSLSSAAGQHELFDRRRAAGLAATTGPLVAILEDRGVPRPDWARRVAEHHARLPDAAIGGAIENGRDRLLNWAVYFCDFGRYQSPFPPGPREYVSDVNICYKRRALEQTQAVWKDRYHETTVHWALQRAGESLYLSPDFAVDQMRDDLSIGRLLRERVGWGRLFAYTRVREISLARRLALAGLTPVLPFVLFARHLRARLEKHRGAGVFLRAGPLVFLLLAGWSLGELIGYLTGEP